MNINNLASLVLIDNLKTIQVVFESTGKVYTYKTTDASIVIGDLVVVVARNLYQIVKVVGIDNTPNLSLDHISYKWIIQKIDKTEHDTLVALEEEAAEKLRELEQQALVTQAKTLLSEKLGVTESELLTQLQSLKTPNKEDKNE